MSYWQPPLSNCSQVECKSSIDSVIYNSSNCSNSSTHEECSPFCSGFPQLVPTIFLAFSCLSAFCCIWVFVTYLIFPRLSGYSSKVFLYRSGLTVRLEYVILLAEMCITAIYVLKSSYSTKSTAGLFRQCTGVSVASDSSTSYLINTKKRNLLCM